MGYLQPVHRAADPAKVVWQPGHQTAEELRDEWYRTHGWVSIPSRKTLAEWAAIQQAEDDYAASQRVSDGADGDSTRSARSAVEVSLAVSPDEGGETPDKIHIEFPSRVYLPCAEAVEDPTAARVDMRQTRDGRTALLVYSSVAALHFCCGDGQAWISMPRTGIADLQNAHPFELVMLDVSIPIEVRRESL